jgi:hypothetical protein
VAPPSDNLGPMTGTMAQYKTEVQKRYKAYDNVEKPDTFKMEDHIGFDQGSILQNSILPSKSFRAKFFIITRQVNFNHKISDKKYLTLTNTTIYMQDSMDQ